MRILLALALVCGACDHDTEAPPEPAAKTPIPVHAVHVPPALPTPPTLPAEATDDDSTPEPDADDEPAIALAAADDARATVIDLSNDVVVIRVHRDDDDIVVRDDDGEGIMDVEDRCPDVPESENGFEDVDGCPDPAQ